MTGEAVHIDSNGQAIHLQAVATPGSVAPAETAASARAAPSAGPGRRADAQLNRAKILTAARTALAEGGETSMAAVARRAGVGMATLYRNFPGRRELLEAVYADEVAAVCDAALAAAAEAPTPGAALRTWLRNFATFITAKHDIAEELLRQADDSKAFGAGRASVLAAAGPLLLNAQQAGQVRAELTLEQVLDLVIAVATIHGSPDYIEPILQTVLDGLLTH